MMTLQQARTARAMALSAGARTYEGQPCGKGHATRYTSNRACVECAKAARKAQLARNRSTVCGTGIEAVARAFCRHLHKEFTATQLREINRRNALPEYSFACATHDFADANEIMDAAFSEIMGFSAADAMTDRNVTIWNRAWAAAKAARFIEKRVSHA